MKTFIVPEKVAVISTTINVDRIAPDLVHDASELKGRHCCNDRGAIGCRSELVIVRLFCSIVHPDY